MQNAGVAGYPIGEVSRRLGVPVPTLRSWHRRYGVAPPQRTEGGHRRYSDRDLQLLQALSQAVARGLAPRVAAQVLASAEDPLRPLALLDRLLAAAEAGDQPGFQRVLDEAVAAVGLERTVDQLLIPSLAEIGRRWEVQLIDVDVEHLATAAARSWIAREAGRATGATGAPVLLAAGPGNEHTVALEAFGLLLQRAGCATRQLGADTPVEVMVSAQQRTGARGAVVTAHLASRRLGAVEGLHRLAAVGVPVFYAGAAFDAPRRRAEVPGRYLGTSLPAAVAVVRQAVAV
jgi:DNA-binding transcriptional MerR regulator